MKKIKNVFISKKKINVYKIISIMIVMNIKELIKEYAKIFYLQKEIHIVF